MKQHLRSFLLLGSSLLLMLASGCYSFQGISIDYATTKTFSMPTFTIAATQADPTTGLKLTEKLRQKVLQTTRLTYKNDEPDVDFAGNIVGFSITSIAPGGNNVATLSRLEMTVSVTYTDHKNAKNSWAQNFTRFADFDPNKSNFEIVKNELIRQINDLLVEDIFNKAFGNW